MIRTTTSANLTESSAPDLPNTYTLIKPIGSGGTAQVALIRRLADNSLWAWKYPHPDNTDFSLQIEREMSCLKNLNFPGVTHITPLAPDNLSAGVTMPYLPGQTLESIGKLDSALGLMNLISSLAILLYYLRLKGVTHGDIKPHNIFLPTDFSGKDLSGSRLYYLRLIDFSMGLCANEEAEKRSGVGTLGYSAPETITNGELTPASDLFSLGVIAHCLATGAHPFLGSSSDPAAIASAVREMEPPDLSAIRDDLPPGLPELISSLLAKEPAARPGNEFEICERLEAMGATYPFRRVILPKHLLPTESEVGVEGISDSPGLDLPARNQLHRISSGDIRKIRLILDENFRQGRLEWRSGAIRAKAGFHSYLWPRFLRQWERREFARLTMTEARWVVRAVVAGGTENLLRVERPPQSLRPASATPALVELLRPEISALTLISQSLRLARKLDLHSQPGQPDQPEKFNDSLELCATMYAQAEELKRAAELTSQLCQHLAQENREVEALPTLELVEALAELQKNSATLIEMLHLDGDIRKALGDMQGAEERYLRIVKASEEIPSLILAETYKDLGDLYKLKQDFGSGLQALAKAQRLYEGFNDSRELARVANNVGNIHWINADYQKALTSYRRALQLHRQRADLANTSSTTSNIASIFAVTGRIDRAVRLYSLALRMKREIGDPGAIAVTLNNLGYAFYLQAKLTRAVEAISEALQINRSRGSKKEILYNLDNLVSCSLAAGRFEETLQLIHEGRDLADELHDRPTKGSFDLNFARVLTRLGSWRKAQKLISRSLSIADEFSDLTLRIQSLIQQADLFARMQRADLALEPQKKALQEARAIKDKLAEVSALLITPEVGEKRREAVQNAYQIAQGLNTRRDKALTALACAQEEARDKNLESAEEKLAEAGKYFDSASEDLEKLRYWTIGAEIALQAADSSRAARILAEAIRSAAQQDENAERWKLEILLSRTCLMRSDYESGYAALLRATSVIKKLVGELPDSATRAAFLNQPALQEMGELIAELKTRLSLK